MFKNYMVLSAQIKERPTEVFTIEVLDMRGRLIDRITDYRPAYGYNVYRLPDLSYLSRGVYLIRLLDGNRQLYVEKLFKQA